MELRRKRAVALSELAGMTWMPKAGRKQLMVWAGADIESGPGRNFRFAGRHANLHIGPGTYMNRRVFIEAIAPVRIGRTCHFGMEAMVLTSHHPIGETGTWTFGAEGKEVTIGDKVWVGARVVVLPGAVVESNVIIAAGAVVAGHCKAGGVYAGVPARLIKNFGPDDENTKAP